MSFFRARARIGPYGYMGEQLWLRYGYLDRVMVQRQGQAGPGILYLRERQPGQFVDGSISESKLCSGFHLGGWKDGAAVFWEVGAVSMELGSGYVNCEKQRPSQGK